MHVKDLLNSIYNSVDVNLYNGERYCGQYNITNKENCYFNDWLVYDIVPKYNCQCPTLEAQIDNKE